jgi:hypothetical protein
MVEQTTPCSPTIHAVRDVAGERCAIVCAGEAVDHDLIDCAGTPLVFGGCGGTWGADEKEEGSQGEARTGCGVRVHWP